jgi:mannitol/fructose-specific phosphotransferase system IIA component (Ntr-type)
MIDSIRTECIKIGTSASDKADVIKEISLLAKKSDILKNISAGEIEEALIAREDLISTGLSDGIAIPHCSFDGIDRFVVGLLVVNEGIDFEAIDGKDSKLFFFIVGPKTARNKHIKILSSISKISKDKEMLNTLVKSSSESEVGNLLKRQEDNEIPVNKVDKSQFVIHVQNEELFYDVLEILSSEVEGAVSVIDASTAGSYLHRLPLFSSFWNDKVNQFSKVIITVIDKRLMNDTIRRLNMVLPEDGRGIIISVSDILYFDGSIDF